MEVFKTIAGFNEWMLIWPEITLGLLAIFLIVVDLFLPEKYKNFIPLCAFVGQLVICVALCLRGEGRPNFNFNQLIYQSVWIKVIRVFFLTSSLLVTYLGCIYFKKHALIRSEFYAILMIATGALMLLVQANHFVMVFVALETFAIAGFVLTSYDRMSAFSLEAGLKFLIFGALSSAILLFGIVLLYGVAGNPMLENSTADALNFTQLGKFIEVNAHNPLVQVGAVLVLVGLFFKMGVVPFQVWIPDVYQGAPTPVTALLAVSSKAAGFIVVLNLVHHGDFSWVSGDSYGPFFHLNYLLVPLLSGLTVITILYGNIAALSQSNVKKLMGYSGIA
ncbi:MAG: NADH-quinone oxidoreductase subunit N, partial [Candidatus Paceibacterales bacterium]